MCASLASRDVRASPFLALLGLCALLGACGGSSYTKRDFIARADAICASALRQTRSISPGTNLAVYLAAVLPVVKSEADQLGALRRPPGTARDRSTLAQYLAAMRQSVGNYRQLAGAAQRGDQEAVASAEASLASSPLESLAASYGLTSCASPTATVG